MGVIEGKVGVEKVVTESVQGRVEDAGTIPRLLSDEDDLEVMSGRDDDGSRCRCCVVPMSPFFSRVVEDPAFANGSVGRPGLTSCE